MENFSFDYFLQECREFRKVIGQRKNKQKLTIAQKALTIVYLNLGPNEPKRDAALIYFDVLADANKQNLYFNGESLPAAL